MTNSSAVVVAAHPDDEVLGCGGTIAKLAGQGVAVHVLLVADGEGSRLEGSERMSAAVAERDSTARAACKILGCTSVELLGFPDNRLDGVELLTMVKRIEEFLERHRPITVFTHHAGDVNIDHRRVHDAVIAACRPLPGRSVEQLLFFEVPSATEWRPPSSGIGFSPNWFVDVSTVWSKKVEALQVYAAELRPFPHPRSIEAIDALARWRGASAGVAAAEAFVLGRKVVR